MLRHPRFRRLSVTVACCLFIGVLFWFLHPSQPFSAAIIWKNTNTELYEWQAITASFTGTAVQEDPLDYTSVVFSALVSDQTGKGLLDDASPTRVYGFWDGGKNWRVRFTPTRPGTWTLVTDFSAPIADLALHGKQRTFTVLAAHDDAPPIFRYGGFLRTQPATATRRGHFTYTDGATPFNWLSHKIHSLYGTDGSMEDYRRIIGTTAARGFSVYSWLGLHQPRRYPVAGQSRTGSGNVFVFTSVGNGLGSTAAHQAAAARRYWDEMDSLVRYGAQNGLVLAMGIGSYDVLSRYDLEQHKRAWAYLQARLGAYPVLPAFTQEYNLLFREPPCRTGETPVRVGSLDRCAFSETAVQDRINDYFDLVRFYQSRDPYRRATALHSAVLNQTLCGASVADQRSCTLGSDFNNHQDWAATAPTDFLLLQVGHRRVPQANQLAELNRILNAENVTKPFVIDEYNYEGFGDQANSRGTTEASCKFSLTGTKFLSGSQLVPLDRTRPHVLVDDAYVRQSMLVALQSGAAGYTYSAQGLYAMIVSALSPRSTPNWGPVLLWQEGLALRGSSQLQFIRNAFVRYGVTDFLPDTQAVSRTEGPLLDRLAVSSRRIGNAKEYLVAYLAPVKHPCTAYVDLAQYFSGLQINGVQAGGTYIARMMSTRSNTQWERVLMAGLDKTLPLPNLYSAQNSGALIGYDMLMHVERIETVKGLLPMLHGYHAADRRYILTPHPDSMENVFIPMGFTSEGLAFYFATQPSFTADIGLEARSYNSSETTPVWQLTKTGPIRQEYVVDAVERDSLIVDGWQWKNENVKGYFFTQPGYKRVPLYRVFRDDDTATRHLVTAPIKDRLVAEGWVLDEAFGPYYVVTDPLDL